MSRAAVLVAACSVAASMLACPREAAAEGPPEGDAIEGPQAATTRTVSGRVRVAGRREPLADVRVIVVDAPSDVRPGRPAREPLDPEALAWIREGTSDAEGRFTITDVPLGKVRIVVLAPGHVRFEQWAEVEARGDELELFVEPEAGYRTEVVSERAKQLGEPEHALAAEQAQVYPGSGGDVVRAAQNLPGVARSPGGVGLLAIRGGDPRQTGIYLDGHPVPRAFHVLPLASVVAPGLVDRVELTPGNYDMAFGGHSAGLVQIQSRAGQRAGVHGRAHLDLFDVAGTIEAPVGAGSVIVGARRSHVDALLGAVNLTLGSDALLLPGYWDYLARFEHPTAPGHMLTIRALGAGDVLRGKGPAALEFGSGFHRFDLAYAIAGKRWRISLSPALRLDEGKLAVPEYSLRRRAKVGSLRVSLARELRSWVELQLGSDLVFERWHRHETAEGYNPSTVTYGTFETRTDGRELALGVWVGFAFRIDTPTGPLQLRPQLRGNLFWAGDEARVMPDPRLDLRWRVHERVELFGAIGQFSAPVVLGVGEASTNLINRTGNVGNGRADVPTAITVYFDPGIEGEVAEGSLLVSRTLQTSLGAELELPWSLTLRATGFFRETGPQSELAVDARGATPRVVELRVAQQRAYGLELLLGRMLAKDIHGWIGYTLLRSESRFTSPQLDPWRPTRFDQRHNLVVLASFGLPRGFRFGLRFRLVSGNPDTPVIGAETWSSGAFLQVNPVRAQLGMIDRPLFHQLDLRLDKTWIERRVTVTTYLDVQNVYNHLYPEIDVYSGDFRERTGLLGLPIFPSLGVRVDY